MRYHVTGCWIALAALSIAVPSSAQVIINEILADVGSQYDGAEFVELYNPTGAAVDLSFWTPTGTEFSGTCGGERHWQFPSGASIPAGGYLIVAKGNIVTVPGDEQDAFFQRFGFDPDWEQFDSNHSHDSDDSAVPNMILLNQSTFNDQLGFIGASETNGGMGGFGASCSSIFNQYEALYLYDGSPLLGGVIVDEIEYRNPVTCLADACTGVGTSDNDAFLGLPDVGQALCRDASGSDTNNSGVDLHLGTPTPGAVNIANAGPDLSSLNVSNPAPKASETTDVSITAIDADGIGAVYVVYAVNDTTVFPWLSPTDSVAMTSSGLDLYVATIGPFLDGDNIKYWVSADDAGNAAGVGFSKYPDFGYRSLRWGTQTIFDVQFHTPPSDTGSSAEVGNAVNVEGVVTTEPGPFNTTSNNIFTIQSGAGFWNGVHVVDFLGEASAARGDSVRVSGEVGEYFGLTQVQIFGQEAVQVLDSNRPLPAPFDATASQLTTGATFGELLEGVLTHVDSVEVTLADDGFGSWHVSDPTGTFTVGDDAFYNYNPTLGDSLDALEGIVGYSFSERKLEPRDDSDIQGPPVVSTVRYSPLPPTAASSITISATITDNGSIASANLLYFLNTDSLTVTTTALTNTVGDTYAATVGPFPDGTRLNYHVEVADNVGFAGRAPSAGDYDLRVGLQTIATVQGTTNGLSDASVFDGLPTNLSGIVTMLPGTTADNIFAIQNHWAGSPAYTGVLVYSGGSLVGALELGDSVTVAGDVDEFNGLTEIRMHWTDAYVNHGGGSEVPSFSLDTSDFLPDSTGILPAAEQYEGVLIQFDGSTVTNNVAGFGQWFIDNTAPATGQETLVDDESRFGGLAYTPALSDMYTFRGIGWFSFGEYKLQPRDDTDVLPFDPADAVGVNPGLPAGVDFGLAQNSPNPFTTSATRITYAVPRASDVSLHVFDVQGRLVRTLVSGPVEAGAHTVMWNGRNDQEREVSAGVY
ncbi:lamin tail domain-containing protein, partial [bacterium]|nr:lamin tail domain-containing protein [bacterium]